MKVLWLTVTGNPNRCCRSSNPNESFKYTLGLYCRAQGLRRNFKGKVKADILRVVQKQCLRVVQKKFIEKIQKNRSHPIILLLE